MTNTRRMALLVCTTLCSFSSHARAQSSDSAVAQALFDDAKLLMAKGHAADACPKLEESQHLEPRSGTLINLASCYEQTNRLASAWSTYIEAATSAKSAGNTERERVARERAAALVPRIAKLTINVAPELKNIPGLEVSRDGVQVREPEWGLALPANAGPHVVSAAVPGYATFKSTAVVVGEGSNTSVNVPLLTPQAAEVSLLPGPVAPAGAVPVRVPRAQTEPAPKAQNGLGTSRIVALVAAGVGVVGVGVGAGFGLASKSKHDEAAKSCDATTCGDPAGNDASAAAIRDGNLATLFMIVGGVGLAAGATLWLTAPKSTGSEPSAQLGLGVGTVRLRGVF